MTVLSNKLDVVASNCSTPGILLFNGKTYCMKFGMLITNSNLNQIQIGTGTLIVYQPDQPNSYYNGTYYNTPIYLSDHYLYVLPQLEFSMVSITPYD